MANFWKLSQGADLFSFAEIVESIYDRVVYVHKDTGAKGKSSQSQITDFVNAKDGDYFYLTHGNKRVYLLGQFNGPASPARPTAHSDYGDWIERPFKLIRPSLLTGSYKGDKKWWAPNDNSTFTKVPDKEVKLFEEAILKPYFDFPLSILPK